MDQSNVNDISGGKVRADEGAPKKKPLVKDKDGNFIKNRCVNKLRAEVIKEKTTAAEAIEYIKKNTAEVYELPDGYMLKGINILGESPIYIGLKLKKKEIVFYFNKPCFGTYLYKIKAVPEDFEKIRLECKRVEN